VSDTTDEPVAVVPDLWAYAPCGECRELVPTETGCSHWRPGRLASNMTAATRSARNAAKRTTSRDYRTGAAHQRSRDVAEFKGLLT
jgi:hypothetical protein